MLITCISYRTLLDKLLLALYNYHYIRPDRAAETLYHADPGRIMTFVAVYTGGSRA